jgi:hypothetical protein
MDAAGCFLGINAQIDAACLCVVLAAFTLLGASVWSCIAGTASRHLGKTSACGSAVFVLSMIVLVEVAALVSLVGGSMGGVLVVVLAVVVLGTGVVACGGFVVLAWVGFARFLHVGGLPALWAILVGEWCVLTVCMGGGPEPWVHAGLCIGSLGDV